MNAQDLRILLEKTDDKLSILTSKETLIKYDLYAKELYELIADFLTDEEKLKLFDYSLFQQFNEGIRMSIIRLISDENIKLQAMSNDNIIKGINSYDIKDLVMGMSDDTKIQLLYNQGFLEKHKFDSWDIKNIIISLNDSIKEKILMDVDLIINKLHLEKFEVTSVIKGLLSDDAKSSIFEEYELEDYQKIEIIKTYSDENKLTVIKDSNFKSYDVKSILTTLEPKTLSKLFENDKQFLVEKDIQPYEIIQGLDEKNQKEFVANLENVNLTDNEKKEIIVTLKSNVKQSIDIANLPEEYKKMLSIETTEYSGRIILNFERELEDYRGLDNLMKINPEEFTEEQKCKFKKLCEICPNMKVINNMGSHVEMVSTANEYIEAEEWISSVLNNIKPEYSNAQKIAIIDNAIGKKISYSPDFDTEVSDFTDCRALWKIISSGYGVCNGIARVEQYILNRVGIQCERVSSKTHSFLKINDIEIHLANGEIAMGNTILDPTWNLVNHRFGAMPDNFFINYEQARKNDIDGNRKDHNCHKNDEELQDATLNLDEQSLRQLFASVGLADKDGEFPIKDLIEKSKLLDEVYANEPDKNIDKQFLLLAKKCPEFATCQNSSMKILSDILLDNENLKFNKCIVNRVYNKADKEKRPIIFVYINSDELGEKFYYANKDEGKFVESAHDEFIQQFECYEEDLKKNNGLRLWESTEMKKEDVDLSRSSGKIVAQEGDER